MKTHMLTETRKAGIIKVTEAGVTVRLEGRKQAQTISWDKLRDAAANNGNLTNYYADLLHRAENRVLSTLPMSLRYGYTNTNVFGVYGEGVDGKMRPIRSWHLDYWPLRWLAADEGQSLYSRSAAKQEAQEIADRISTIWPARHRLQVLPHPSLALGYAAERNF